MANSIIRNRPNALTPPAYVEMFLCERREGKFIMHIRPHCYLLVEELNFLNRATFLSVDHDATQFSLNLTSQLTMTTGIQD